MGKKVLFIVHDDSHGNSPRSWSNIGELTTFDSRNFTSHDEGKNRWDDCLEALMRDFSLGAHWHNGKGGGLVFLLDRDPRDGTLSINDEIVYTEAMIAARQDLEDELGEYASDDIAERLGLDFSGIDGLMIVPFATIISEYGSLGADALSRARSYIEGEIETYNTWATGDIYGGVIVDASTGEEEDSCYGFYGSDPKRSGLLEHFEYDEIANDGDPYYDRYEMQRAIDALVEEAEDEDEDEDEDGGRTPNPSQRDAISDIRNQRPFKASALSGGAEDKGTGRLNDHGAVDFRVMLREAKAEGPLRDTFYAVYSYATPIAWWVRGHGWTIVSKTALEGSATTNKHLSIVKQAIGNARVVNPASSRRPRR